MTVLEAIMLSIQKEMYKEIVSTCSLMVVGGRERRARGQCLWCTVSHRDRSTSIRETSVPIVVSREVHR